VLKNRRRLLEQTQSSTPPGKGSMTLQGVVIPKKALRRGMHVSAYSTGRPKKKKTRHNETGNYYQGGEGEICELGGRDTAKADADQKEEG